MRLPDPIDSDERETLPLAKALELLLEECRMVLPGIQGLFGFQLIAVFSEQFHRQLGQGERELHLLAIALVAIAIALIMTPAATHRQLNPREVTADLLRLSTRVLLWSLAPLAVALCLDFYLVARIVTGSYQVAWLAAALLAVFVGAWWVLPRAVRRRATRGR